MVVFHSYHPRGVATLAAASAIALSAWLGARQDFVPAGGDVPAYLLAARYNPLGDSFDNPSHGWGYPALVKLLACSGLDAHRAGLWVSAASSGILVFVAVQLGFRYLPNVQAISMSLILACHPLVVIMGATALSDSLFAAIVSLVVWLLFVRDSSLPVVALAGVLAMLSAFVRGNGIVLIICTSAGLSLTPNRCQRLATFLLGVVVCFTIAACVFSSQGLPRRLILRSGAGELAFATLDKTGTWRHRRSYETEYSNYLPLITRHWRELTRTAAKTVYHLYDWWLIPSFPALSWFMVPGLLLWVRRLSASALALMVTFLGVQATFLWSGRFQEGRHLLASVPFLTLLAMTGILLLPRRASSRRIPIRGLMTALVTTSCVGLSVAALGSIGKASRSDHAMHEAARWLRSHSKTNNYLVSTRLNIAYYSELKPLDYTDVFRTDEPNREEVSHRLRASGARWIAWIRGHSHKEFPKLQWLERDEIAPELELVYRNEYVSIWELNAGPRSAPR